MTATVGQRLLRHERLLVLGGILAVAGLAWLYLVQAAAGMGEAAGGAGAMAAAGPSWSVRELVLLFAMWAVMMAAMMLPGAAPAILLYATLARKTRERGGGAAPSALFAVGYLVAWTAFSVAATAVQWALHEAALLSPMMVAASPALGAALFLAAGVYQWTPLKDACLAHCRSPLDFFATRWRKGRRGAVRMGLEHGLYCVGCCWVLMALLFAGGVMNLLWVAALALLVMVEKLAPHGAWTARAVGALCIGTAGYLAIQL